MGSSGSKNAKITEQTAVEAVCVENVIPTTPILSPEPRKKLGELDPRSPSTYLSRTPLEVLYQVAGKLSDLKEVEYVLETPEKCKTVVLGIDPRSPTAEFKRTPIVINADESEMPKKIYNRNLDRVRQFSVITPKSTKEKPSTANIIPPKLLESSPINPRPEINKRKSLIGLLETNIDFTETDLDTVIQEKFKTNEKSAPTVEDDCTDVSSNENTGSCLTNEPIKLGKDACGSTQSIGNDLCSITRDDQVQVNVNAAVIEGSKVEQLVVAELQQIKMANDELVIRQIVEEICDIIDKDQKYTACNASLENLEIIKQTDIVESQAMVAPKRDQLLEISDIDAEELKIPVEIKSAPATPTKKNVKKQKSIPILSPINKQTKSAPVSPPMVNLTADVNELDKKLTNLIYEDEDMIVCPRIVRLKDENNRSPLKSYNMCESDKRKSVQKLKVSDKPRKSEYAVSRIPVFKEKRNKGQCENTPPRNMEKRKVKSKKPQWDNTDNTLMI
ncbi:hypothetical protein NQ317_009661 [Molorchus minor]|uniref:Uncharacterized protein n=1 Tax=Molorchus minor TaxID=1323400 RepID=A0ABQ9JKN2_9CUCU|nr:hypothetical protein NQ317_009661 [Molorchus minor]